jgi:uncharacterized protein YegP (UPF0339 family)
LTFLIFLNNGRYYWTLHDGEGPIVRSEATYPTKDECLDAIRELRERAPVARVVDHAGTITGTTAGATGPTASGSPPGRGARPSRPARPRPRTDTR